MALECSFESGRIARYSYKNLTIMSEEKAEVPADKTKDQTGETVEHKVPSLLHNYISLAGISASIASLASILLLFLMEMTSSSDQPYLGILIYIVLPAALILGLFVIAVGAVFERWRRRKMSPEEIAAYPILDLNGPKRRRSFFIFLTLSVLFLCMSAFGSYRAYEFSESVTFCGETCHTVMRPEFVAYTAASHSRVKCVECHVGGGAENYVRSKFAGVRQLYKVAFDSFDRPIKTPIHNMNPANETCAKCHWPEKFYGDQLRVFDHYAYDEENSLNRTRMLIKVGGGDPNVGQATGIHWHMNINNEITYVASDDKRQNIEWVRMKNGNGQSIEYTAAGSSLSEAQIAKASKRKMDCIDCHNRPTHIYLSPNKALDNSFTAGRLDRSLPYLKREAAAVLSKPYKTTEEALRTIASDLDRYYKSSHPDLYDSKGSSINNAVVEVQRVYSTYFFPEMKTDWTSHLNNIGHYDAQGCFRCHNGQFKSKSGKTIRNDCNICHTTLDQTFGGNRIVPEDGMFRHPINLGDRNTFQCATCHTGNTAFRHPLNLGDISRFQCADCHKEGFKKTDLSNLRINRTVR